LSCATVVFPKKIGVDTSKEVVSLLPEELGFPLDPILFLNKNIHTAEKFFESMCCL